MKRKRTERGGSGRRSDFYIRCFFDFRGGGGANGSLGISSERAFLPTAVVGFAR